MKKAMTKIKMSLTNNVGIKIIAVLVAAIVWLAVINVNDPEKTVVLYNIPITMTDEDVITDMGMVYNLNSKDKVNITISGKRSVVSNLTAEDFTATASLSELSKVNAIPIEISANQKSIASKITIVKQSIQTVTVSIENIEKQQFDIEAEFSGKTADGYVTGSYSLSKQSVTIEAPESVLNKIERVVAVCDLNGSNSGISQKCDLILYDKKDRVIKSEDISMSIERVTVNVDVLKEKEVTISLNSVGSPASGYQISDVTLSMETVKLIGAPDTLKGIKSLELDGEVDVAGQKADVIQTIDLSKLLPEGVTIEGTSEVEVTVKIEKLASKTFTIKAEDISVDNLKDGLSMTISTKSIKVTLRGEKSVIDQIHTDDIKASIDLKGYGKGTSKVPVTITIPDGTELTSQVSVKVKIK